MSLAKILSGDLCLLRSQASFLFHRASSLPQDSCTPLPPHDSFSDCFYVFPRSLRQLFLNVRLPRLVSYSLPKVGWLMVHIKQFPFYSSMYIGGRGYGSAHPQVKRLFVDYSCHTPLSFLPFGRGRGEYSMCLPVPFIPVPVWHADHIFFRSPNGVICKKRACACQTHV